MSKVGYRIIPDTLIEADVTFCPLVKEADGFGVEINVERTFTSLSGRRVNIEERAGKNVMVEQVKVTLSVEDATRLWNELPAAIEKAKTRKEN